MECSFSITTMSQKYTGFLRYPKELLKLSHLWDTNNDSLSHLPGGTTGLRVLTHPIALHNCVLNSSAYQSLSLLTHSPLLIWFLVKHIGDPSSVGFPYFERKY